MNAEKHVALIEALTEFHSCVLRKQPASNSGRIQQGPVGWPGAGLPSGGGPSLKGLCDRGGEAGLPPGLPAVVRAGRASPGDSSPIPARHAETESKVSPGHAGQRCSWRPCLSEQNPVRRSSGACRGHEGPRRGGRGGSSGGGNRSRDDPPVEGAGEVPDTQDRL